MKQSRTLAARYFLKTIYCWRRSAWLSTGASYFFYENGRCLILGNAFCIVLLAI